MSDIREAILVRFLAIVGGIIDPDRIRRNSDDLSAKSGHAAVLSDGDETITDIPLRKNNRGDPRITQDYVQMSPNLTIIVGANTENVGTELNALRATLLPAIINDGVLISLVGPNGEIRYTGLNLETQAGENREGRLSLDLRLTYVLDINKLGS